MRTDIPSALQDHLNTRVTTLCWCWKLTLTNGTVQGFTNHDEDVTFDSVTYEASTGFLGTEIESQLGMAVDNMDVFSAVDSINLTEEDLEAGRYDSAVIEFYLVNWRDVAERVIIKKGILGQIERGNVNFRAEVRSLSTKLQQVQGRVYSYTCDASLGDSRCGVSLSGSTYTGTGVVVTTNGFSSLTASGLDSYETEWFKSGLITISSGLNADIAREVKGHFAENGIVTISLWEPLPFELSVSDTFTIQAGCDKLFSTCKAKFGNATNFQGFPHIPGNDTLLQYAVRGEGNFDGGGNFFGKD